MEEEAALVFLSIEQEDAAAAVAFEILKKQTGWARVQERLSLAIGRRIRDQDKPATLQARRREALRHFSFQAITYLDLVRDSGTADAFCNLLPLLVRAAYVSFCGQPPQVARPVSAEAFDFERKIEFRFHRWMARAHQRAQAPPSTEPGDLLLGVSDRHASLRLSMSRGLPQRGDSLRTEL
jgi:hypothetical protein